MKERCQFFSCLEKTRQKHSFFHKMSQTMPSRSLKWLSLRYFARDFVWISQNMGNFSLFFFFFVYVYYVACVYGALLDFWARHARNSNDIHGFLRSLTLQMPLSWFEISKILIFSCSNFFWNIFITRIHYAKWTKYRGCGYFCF